MTATDRTTVDFRYGVCTCGCCQRTMRRFVPGHNARLRAALKRSATRAEMVRIVQSLQVPQLVSAGDACQLLGDTWLAALGLTVDEDQQ